MPTVDTNTRLQPLLVNTSRDGYDALRLLELYNDRTSSRLTAFFSAVDELDPTLAVVLGRPRLGTKI